MQGRKVGSVLTSGLLALALALAVLQATVLVNSASPERVTTSASSPQAPVQNGAVPWVPAPAPPSEREGRTPGSKPPREQHRPGLRPPGMIPQVGPRPMRKAVA
jgi:hypothetical protein